MRDPEGRFSAGPVLVLRRSIEKTPPCCMAGFWPGMGMTRQEVRFPARSGYLFGYRSGTLRPQEEKTNA